MTKISEHLQHLMTQRAIPLWEGYVNMLKILESVFLSPKHWILEFLQNAEDANAKKFCIRLDQNSIWILNNGDVFKENDFYALCDVNSRKLPSLGFRGYLGVGFKSIFRITDKIEIHSGDYHFKFDKLHWNGQLPDGYSISKWPWEVLPVEIMPTDLPFGYTTGFYIPFESTRSKQVLQDIENFLLGDEFPKEAILLLKNCQDYRDSNI